jgi:L-ascorbate metabolism protein UlaG (beta-lactamase superfamily)
MVVIRWFGHAAFEIVSGGERILVDPWLSNPLSPIKPGEYREEPDLIVVTHAHDDHVGDTVELMRRHAGTKLAAIFELALHLQSRVGGNEERFIGGNIGGPMRIPGLKTRVALTPALHSSPVGAPTGVLIFTEDGVVYHAGDTGLFAEMSLIGELYKPRVALLPIGGHFTMDIVQAVKAVEMLKPEYVIPMHYNTFPVIEADPAEFKKMVEEKVPGVKVVVLKPGESVEL